MRKRLLRGFYLGEILVQPLQGSVTGTGPPRQLTPEAVDVLLHLASTPREFLSAQYLTEEVWGENHGSREALVSAIREIQSTLHQAGSPAGLVEYRSGSGYRLASDVRPGYFSEVENNAADAPPPQPAGSASPSGWLMLWTELRKRRVVRVGIGYLVMAWLLLQIGDVVSDALELPAWSMKLLTVLLTLGFITTLVVSWLLQVTPAGIRRDHALSGTLKHELRHAIELSIIAVLLVTVGFLTYRQFWQTGTAGIVEGTVAAAQESRLPGIESAIAVLPFRNLGENRSDQYFGRGLAEEILHKLANVRSMKAAARTSSFYYGDHGTDIPTIAADMKVDYVLEGSVRRESGRVRVTAQLVNAEGFHLWSHTYDLRAGDMLDVQSQIAINVAKAIDTNLSPELREILARPPTESEEAYNFYLRGLEYLRMPRLPDNLERAGDFFDRALAIDPRYARAHAARCEVELGWYRYNGDLDHFAEAERACNRALTLDAGQFEVHTALGNLYRSSSQFEEAQMHFERALDLYPYHEEANYGLAKSLQSQGALEEAEQILRYSIELEPGYWAAYTSLGVFLFQQGRSDEAIPFFEKVTELMPDSPNGWTNLGSALFDEGDWEATDVAWSHSVELEETPMGYRNLATLYYYQGRFAEAAEMAEAGITLAPKSHWLWGKLAASTRYLEGAHETSHDAYRNAIRMANDRLAVDAEDSETMAYLAAYYLNIGADQQAVEWINRAMNQDPGSPDVWYFSAIINNRLDRVDETLDDLRRSIELGYPGRLIAADRELNNLHELESFNALFN